MSKKVNIDLSVINQKVANNFVEINKLIEELNKKLEEQGLKTININDKNFDLSQKETPKNLKFTPSYFGNLDNDNMYPYPKNFTSDETLVSTIKNADEAIRYIAKAYNELITDLPIKVQQLIDKFDFDKNWKEIPINTEPKRNIYYLLIRDSGNNEGQVLVGQKNIVVYDDYYLINSMFEQNSTFALCQNVTRASSGKVYIFFASRYLKLVYYISDFPDNTYNFDKYHKLYQYIGSDKFPVFLGKSK